MTEQPILPTDDVDHSKVSVMPDGLYERDALSWAEQQAMLLRRLAAGERLNETLDWPHIIEEVQEVGLSELRAVMSLLQQAMTHLLKLHAWPASKAAGHWHDEAGTFLDDVERRFTPSMRQRIDLAALYGKARRRARTSTDDSGTARPVPDDCPFDLDTLLAGDIPALMQVAARPDPVAAFMSATAGILGPDHDLEY